MRFALSRKTISASLLILSVVICSIQLSGKALAAGPVLRVGIGFTDQIYNSPTGAANNFDILFSYQILTSLGYQVEFVVAPYARLTFLLSEKKIDVATRQAQQLDALRYSSPYLQFQNKVFALASFKPDLGDLTDLACCELTAFQNASVALGPAFANVSRRAKTYREVLDHAQAIQLLLKGRTELLVMDERTFYRRLAELNADPNLIRSFHLLPLVQYRLAFHQSALQQQVETQLQRWLAAGELKKIRQQAAQSPAEVSALLQRHLH